MGNPFDDEEEFDLAAVEARHAEMEAEARLEAETVDVTIPGTKPSHGHKHPMYSVLDEMKEIFPEHGL